jgi:hypothetical protein
MMPPFSWRSGQTTTPWAFAELKHGSRMKFPTRHRQASFRLLVADGAKQRPDFDCTGIVGAPAELNARKIVAVVRMREAAGPGDTPITANTVIATKPRVTWLTARV